MKRFGVSVLLPASIMALPSTLRLTTNFQAVSVGQKLIENGVKGGYLDADATPSANLVTEVEFVDKSIAEMISELKEQGLYGSTLIIITAKHGQSPIDPNRFFAIPGHGGGNGESPATLIATRLPGYIPFSESPLNPTGIGPTEDDVSLLWLSRGSDTVRAADLLEANAQIIGLGQIYYGQSLRSMLDRPGAVASGQSQTSEWASLSENGRKENWLPGSHSNIQPIRLQP